jgi:hypothetical protein
LQNAELDDLNDDDERKGICQDGRHIIVAERSVDLVSDARRMATQGLDHENDLPDECQS